MIPPAQRPSRRRLRPALALATVAVAALVAGLLAAPHGKRIPSRSGLHRVGGDVARVAQQPCPRSEGPFVAGIWPSACWRPYSPSSPFNRPLPEHPRVDARSRAIVDRLAGFGGPQSLLVGNAGTAGDYGHPAFWSSPDDPTFTIHCTKPWGRCPLEGMRVRVPDAAKPAGGSDAHLTVVDQSGGWEYDLWDVEEKPAGGGTLSAGWGGRTRIDGTGLGSDGVAAGYGTLAGLLRPEELAAGQIDHALFMFVSCDSGRIVFPASHGGRSCEQIGESDRDAPAMGQRFQLDMSEREIDALAAPPWKKAILRAMARYGLYVGDTGGTWGIKEQGGTTYTSFGYKDRWIDAAKAAGVPYDPRAGAWSFDLASGVDWQRLRVVDPCVTRGTC